MHACTHTCTSVSVPLEAACPHTHQAGDDEVPRRPLDLCRRSAHPLNGLLVAALSFFSTRTQASYWGECVWGDFFVGLRGRAPGY